METLLLHAMFLVLGLWLGRALIVRRIARYASELASSARFDADAGEMGLAIHRLETARALLDSLELSGKNA